MSAVVTVPLSFDREAREIVSECAEEAGFTVVQVISEPAAACMAYGLGQLDPDERYRCLVYRAGGISVTATVVLIHSGFVSVLGSVERPALGGEKVTGIVKEQLASEFRRYAMPWRNCSVY